jgi:hypothetical protein
MKTICFVVLLSVPVTSAVADRQVTVRPFDYNEIVPVIVGPVDPSSTCQVGNLNSPAWIVRDFVLPQEEYKLVFQSLGTCTNCIFGFEIDRIHVLLETSQSCTITMSLDVEETATLAPGCEGPGDEWCNSGLWNVMLPDSGAWDVSFPLNCPCLSQQSYLLSLRIEDFDCDNGTRPSLVTDAWPNLCTNWNDIGTGWYDLLAEWPSAWPGDLLFWADAACCNPPVPVEETTWGAIKSLYRR